VFSITAYAELVNLCEDILFCSGFGKELGPLLTLVNWKNSLVLFFLNSNF